MISYSAPDLRCDASGHSGADAERLVDAQGGFYMPKGLKLTFPDGRREAVVWPDEVDPECIMEERGASLVDPMRFIGCGTVEDR
jgi:hypothetical protein